jgi:hypothetical protein
MQASFPVTSLVFWKAQMLEQQASIRKHFSFKIYLKHEYGLEKEKELVIKFRPTTRTFWIL